jgi:large conductance mechanosensitive channel
VTGFKNFILRGNLIEIAVAFIMAAGFAAVVTAFTAFVTAQLPKEAGEAFAGAQLGDFAFFVNAVIAFLIMAAVVYFGMVLPYTKAKERFFPAEETGTPADIALLTEIRDAIQTKGGV